MKKKILIIKIGALGDFILQTGRLKMLLEKHRNDEVYLMTGPSLVKISEAMGFKNIFVDTRSVWNPLKWMKIILFWRKNFDIIYDLQSSKRTIKKYFSIHRFMVTKDFSWIFNYNHNFYERKVSYQKNKIYGQLSENIFSLPYKFPDLSDLKSDKDFNLPEKFILIIPGCSAKNSYKRWPSDLYKELRLELNRRGFPSVLIGTTEEGNIVNEIASGGGHVINLLSLTNIFDIAEIARKAFVCVGNDTGPTHIASICCRKTVVLFDQKTATSANNFDGIANLVGKRISDITVQQVLDAIFQ